ncbi:MAG: hypothetical protein IKY44_06955 [Clostridia bacterium]|nr:hypothetical protein [Clostridia bacterium]
MKKLSVLLALVLVIACLFAGCSIKKDVVGTWNMTVDISDVINELTAEDLGEMEEYFTFKDFKLKVAFTFKDDDTVEMKGDEAVLKASIDALVDQMVDGMEKYFEDVIKMAELDMTVEELLATEGMTMDDLREEMEKSVNEMGVEDIFKSYTGTYTIEDKKITVKSAIDGEETIDTYEYVDGKLYLRDSTDESDEYKEMFELLKKTPFEKAA